jgi:hypothetical protein
MFRAAVGSRLGGVFQIAWGVGLLLCTGLVAIACQRSLPPADLTVSLSPDPTAPTSVRVTGFSSDELADLSAAAWSVDRWHELMGVTVGGTGEVFVAGRYDVRPDAVEFVPAFPFDAGRSYSIRVDPSKLVQPRAGSVIQATLSTTPKDAGAPTTVTAIHPDMAEWPANLLRFYVHFSAPMARHNGVEFVRILDSHGIDVKDALLESPVDFWSADQQRFTVFFDPGRVKSDLVPNQLLGRALRVGERYTIAIEQAWKDAHGRMLAAPYRKDIRIVAPVNQPLRLADWRIRAPRSGSRDALEISVPWPLDHALFERAVGVAAAGEPIEGRAVVQPGEREWQFVPHTSWSTGAYEVVVLSVLEDVSGNLVDQAFEVDPKTSGTQPRPERYTIPFSVGP